MSSSVAAQSQKKQKTQKTSRARGIALGVLLVIFVLAATGFAYAVVSYGGVSGVEKMLFGLGAAGSSGSGNVPAAPASSSATQSAAATRSAAQTPTVTSGDASSTLPSAAQSAMYNNQLESQDEIRNLLGGKLTGLSFGKATVGTTSAGVPTVAIYATARPKVTMNFANYNGIWYFNGFEPSEPTPAAAVDSRIVAIITQQQARPESQDAVKALLQGQITGVTVTGVTKGAGTATVYATVNGAGTYAGKPCKFVLIRKANGTEDLWFLSSFSWQ